MSPELEEDIKTIRLNEKHPWPWAFGQVATEHVVYRMIAALEEAEAQLASAKADRARYLAWLGDPSIALEEREWVFLQSEEIQAKLDAAIASQQEKT